jgi:hypothetical protein
MLERVFQSGGVLAESVSVSAPSCWEWLWRRRLRGSLGSRPKSWDMSVWDEEESEAIIRNNSNQTTLHASTATSRLDPSAESCREVSHPWHTKKSLSTQPHGNKIFCIVKVLFRVDLGIFGQKIRRFGQELRDEIAFSWV